MAVSHRSATLLVSLMLLPWGVGAQVVHDGQTYFDGLPPVDQQATVNFYLTEPDYAGCTALDDGVITQCEDLVSEPIQNVAFLWVVFSQACGFPDGIEAVAFGAAHSNMDVLGWANCAGGAQFTGGGWPEVSGSGVVVFWAGNCYEPVGENAKVGFITVGNGGSGTIAIIGSPLLIPPDVQYLTCLPIEDEFSLSPANWGDADLAMGTSPVCAECATPVRDVMWSTIKDWYR